MGEVKTGTVGEITSLLVSDGTDFYTVKLDLLGRIVVLLGFDGTKYVPLATNASGQVVAECKGSA